MHVSYKTTFAAVLYGGFIAGTIDIGAASLINWLSPVVILHAITSGLLGADSFRAGASAALLGLLLQWAMSLVIAAIFVFAAHALPWLKRHWMPAGLMYGVVIFFVMNYMVVPLSAASFKAHHFGATKFVENLLAMLLFGLIVAFCACRLLSGNKTAKPAYTAASEDD
ncbi:MAG: hypothetical protein WCC11_01510 [Gammaproteobacteria bacterium]